MLNEGGRQSTREPAETLGVLLVLLFKPLTISASTAMALISMRYSGDVILQISTMVEAGAGGLKYSRRTLWICSKCSMLRT